MAILLGGLFAVSLVFFCASTNVRLGTRMAVSAHGFSFLATFLSAVGVSEWMGRHLWIAHGFLVGQVVGLGFIIFSILRFEGPKYLHALHVFTLVIALVLLIGGGAYLGGDSL